MNTENLMVLPVLLFILFVFWLFFKIIKWAYRFIAIARTPNIWVPVDNRVNRKSDDSGSFYETWTTLQNDHIGYIPDEEQEPERIHHEPSPAVWELICQLEGKKN